MWTRSVLLEPERRPRPGTGAAEQRASAGGPPARSWRYGTTKSERLSLNLLGRLLVHHDDATREYAYGPDTKVGTFSNALMAEAKKKGWIVISMKNDWKRIFAFDK